MVWLLSWRHSVRTKHGLFLGWTRHRRRRGQYWRIANSDWQRAKDQRQAVAGSSAITVVRGEIMLATKQQQWVLAAQTARDFHYLWTRTKGHSTSLYTANDLIPFTTPMACAGQTEGKRTCHSSSPQDNGHITNMQSSFGSKFYLSVLHWKSSVLYFYYGWK